MEHLAHCLPAALHCSAGLCLRQATLTRAFTFKSLVVFPGRIPLVLSHPWPGTYRLILRPPCRCRAAAQEPAQQWRQQVHCRYASHSAVHQLMETEEEELLEIPLPPPAARTVAHHDASPKHAAAGGGRPATAQRESNGQQYVHRDTSGQKEAAGASQLPRDSAGRLHLQDGRTVSVSAVALEAYEQLVRRRQSRMAINSQARQVRTSSS